MAYEIIPIELGRISSPMDSKKLGFGEFTWQAGLTSINESIQDSHPLIMHLSARSKIMASQPTPPPPHEPPPQKKKKIRPYY